MTARNRPHDPPAWNRASATEERLRTALSAAAGVAVEVRPLAAVPARRRIRLPVMLASVTAAAAAVAAIAFVAVRPAPGVSAPELTEEHIMTMAMSGTTSDQADSVDVSIFLCKRVDPFPECEEGEATEERKAEIRRTLDALPEVKYVHFEDQRVAYESFKAEYRENTVLMGAIQVEDMPESFRVRVVDSADRQMIGTVEEAVQGLPGISNIVNRFCLLHKEEC